MKYQIYKYYKGEKANPFSEKTENSAYHFWEYEKLFEDNFNYGDFSFDRWYTPMMTKQELEEALTPINKEKLFKLWLISLLDRLADKYMTPIETFSKEYFDSAKVSG